MLPHLLDNNCCVCVRSLRFAAWCWLLFPWCADGFFGVIWIHLYIGCLERSHRNWHIVSIGNNTGCLIVCYLIKNNFDDDFFEMKYVAISKWLWYFLFFLNLENEKQYGTISNDMWRDSELTNIFPFVPVCTFSFCIVTHFILTLDKMFIQTKRFTGGIYYFYGSTVHLFAI